MRLRTLLPSPSGRPEGRPLQLLLATTLLAGMVPTMAQAQGAVDEHDIHVTDDATREHRVVIERGHPRPWRMHRGGYLGVNLLDLTPELRSHFGVDESAGVMIATVGEDTPAARAGLRVGDIITSIDAEPIADRHSLARRLGEHKEGDTVSVEVFRAGTYEVLQAEVEQRNRPQFWLNTFGGDDGDFSMEWRTDDDDVLVLPSPGGQRFEIRGDRFEQVLGSLQERLESPDFQARMLEFSSNTEELEQRIKDLEARLLELSKQLEALQD